MDGTQTQQSLDAATTRSSAHTTDWQLLALDALSRLTRQFAQHPDFDKLIDLVLLTVTGQLSITGAFACIANSLDSKQPTIFKGSGMLHEATKLRLIGDSEEQRQYLLSHPDPRLANDIHEDPEAPTDQFNLLAESGVGALVPLAVGDQLLGVLGITRRVDKKPFSEDDLSLLGTLADTMAPLLSNSLLYSRIDSLNTWLREILDCVRHGVFVFSSDLTLKRANTRGKQILEQLKVSPIWSNELVTLGELFPDDRFPGWRDHIRVALLDPQPAGLANFIARSDSGERIYSLHVAQTASEDAAQRDVILTVDDVTAQRENEQHLFELEKFAEKGVMASSISHELNNFLALVLGGLELVELAVTRENFEKAKASLKKLKKNAHTMERFTASLTDYGRMESQTMDIDLNAIVRDVAGFAKVQRRFQRMNLEVTLGTGMTNIHADTDQIAQLLMNLLNNAADAIRDAERPEGRISVKTSIDKNRILLEVTDNGVGIPDELKEKLFQDRFTTKDDGHGYGLVTCGRILAQHEAQYHVSSTPGEGSTIKIAFPAGE